MSSKNVKIIVTVPETHADILREAISNAGGGKIGNYSNCSFSSKGIGRFKPEVGKVYNTVQDKKSMLV